MTSENATRIKFMECRMMGEDSKFVLQMGGNQYLFQVLEFIDMKQYHAFAEANEKTGMPYTQVGSRMVALRFSGNIQHVTITQDTAREIAQGIVDVEQKAAKWYDQYLKSKK